MAIIYILGGVLLCAGIWWLGMCGVSKTGYRSKRERHNASKEPQLTKEQQRLNAIQDKMFETTPTDDILAVSNEKNGRRIIRKDQTAKLIRMGKK